MSKNKIEQQDTAVLIERLGGAIRPCKDCQNGLWVSVDGRTEHYEVREYNGYASLMPTDTDCFPF